MYTVRKAAGEPYSTELQCTEEPHICTSMPHCCNSYGDAQCKISGQNNLAALTEDYKVGSARLPT